MNTMEEQIQPVDKPVRDTVMSIDDNSGITQIEHLYRQKQYENVVESFFEHYMTNTESFQTVSDFYLTYVISSLLKIVIYIFFMWKKFKVFFVVAIFHTDI